MSRVARPARVSGCVVMRRPVRARVRVAVVVSMTCAAAAPVAAQDAPPDGWSFRGELTSVFSAGNAESFTFGLGSVLEHRQGGNLLTVELGGIRTESVRVTRIAAGTSDSFEILEDEDRERTAELYFVRGRYDRSLSEELFAFGALDWMRNTFAGIESRTLLAAGAGNTWVDHEAARFKTHYAVTYTFQTDVVEDPDTESGFAGVRLGWDYWRQVTATTELESRLVGDLNVEETDDVRADFTTPSPWRSAARSR